jgi:hypothetical protein
MKKIASIILLVFAFTLNAQAQKKGGKQNVGKMLKRLSTELNLTDAQQAKIKPLLIAQLADRKAINDKRKALKESGEKLSKKERKEMKVEREAKETAMNSEMANILNKEQFTKFEMMAKERKEKAKQKKKKKQ